MRNVNKHPSGKPEFGKNQRSVEDQVHFTIVTRDDQVTYGVQDQSRSGNKDGVSHPAREDTPQYNGESKKTKVDTSKDYKGMLE